MYVKAEFASYVSFVHKYANTGRKCIKATTAGDYDTTCYQCSSTTELPHNSDRLNSAVGLV